MIIPNIWENKKMATKPPTSVKIQYFFLVALGLPPRRPFMPG